MDVETPDALLARYAASRDPLAREQLILMNLGLVTRLARRYAWRGQDLDDLVQVGAIALINAIDRYDPQRQSHAIPSNHSACSDRQAPPTPQGGLIAFAVPTILGEIRRYFRDRSGAVRLPRRLWELRARRDAVAGRLAQELSRAPTAADIRAAMPDESGTDLDALTQPTFVLSLDEREDHDDCGEGQMAAGLLSQEDAALSRGEDRAEVRRVASRLLPTERILLHLRYYEGLSQAEVGGRMGMSQMHVSRWERRVLEKLRRAMGG
jgi:RNA polymerase sigma-B factor